MDQCWILLLVLWTCAAVKNYSRYHILSVPEEPDFLKSNVLKSRSTGEVDILVAPDEMDQVLTTLKNKNIPYQVKVEDVGELIQNEKRNIRAASDNANGGFNYETYHRLDAIYDHMDLLADTSDKVDIFNIGNTYEGRPIKALRISNDISDAASAKKPIIWLDGGIHAREWISPATLLFFVGALLQNHETHHSEEINRLMDKYLFIISPVLNPDGYEYSHTHERLWRKTRKPSGCEHLEENIEWGGCFSKLCYGSDPNANWDYHWEYKWEQNTDPCDLSYHGGAPFDQNNTFAIKTYLEQDHIKSNLKLFVTYHSYTQLFLTPYGFTDELPPDYEHHKTVGDAFVRAVKGRHGKVYTHKTIYQLGMYTGIRGSSTDWVYGKLGVKDAYGIELRDNGEYGFELPIDQIRETGEENMDGLLAIIQNI